MVYDYIILYKKGMKNIAADTLSRSLIAGAQLLTLSIVTSNLLDRVKASYGHDAHLKSVMTQLEEQPLSYPVYMLRGGVLYRKGKIIVGADINIRQDILQFFHDIVVGALWHGCHLTKD